MADFCKACSLEIFNESSSSYEDFGELKGITKVKSWEKGLAAMVTCEGCGPIQVDPDGNCVSDNCLEQHKEGHGLPWSK